MNQVNKVILNTVAQYVKIICVIVLSLYSTRVVLRELGSSDFGLYSLVGSVLAFLTFLNSAVSRSTQRFLSFYVGRQDDAYQKVIFFNSVLLNFLVSLLVVLIIFLVEPILFNGFLHISNDKIQDARLLYKMIAGSVLCTINVAPINAAFISHEDIFFSSAISIILAITRLLAAFLVSLFDDHKLLWYGLFMFLSSILDYLLHAMVARKRYSECRDFWSFSNYDKPLLYSILSFSWWNLYSSLCVIGRNQGYAFVINKFLSLTANAAYGIANQISAQINNLVYSLSNAVSPIITKSQGGNDGAKMRQLAEASSRISMLMFSVIAIPILYELDFILNMWLGRIPEYTHAFVISVIIACICDSYAVGLRTGIQAIGEIRDFTLVVYTVKILPIPAVVICLYQGISPMYIFIPYIITEVIGTLITVYFYSRYTNSSCRTLILEALYHISVPFIVALLISYLTSSMMTVGWLRLILNFVLTSMFTGVSIYLFGLTDSEKRIVNKLLAQLLRR